MLTGKNTRKALKIPPDLKISNQEPMEVFSCRSKSASVVFSLKVLLATRFFVQWWTCLEDLLTCEIFQTHLKIPPGMVDLKNQHSQLMELAEQIMVTGYTTQCGRAQRAGMPTPARRPCTSSRRKRQRAQLATSHLAGHQGAWQSGKTAWKEHRL